MRQKYWFIDSTCFGHWYAHRQEYNSEFRFLVSKPGKPSGLCSAGLLDVCTAQRMWPDINKVIVKVKRVSSWLCLLHNYVAVPWQDKLVPSVL
jgi:hypothetical protein